MNITFLAYLLSTLLSGLFSLKFYFVQKKFKKHLAREFFVFFTFGFLYFFTRFFAMTFFMGNNFLLSISYPLSHLFLYLSFAFMLETVFSLSHWKKYANKIFKLSLIFGALIIFLNFFYLNNPSVNVQFNVITWGTNSLVSKLHLINAFFSIVAISYIFISQSFKAKPFNRKYFLVGFGYAFLLINILKNFFHSGMALFFFEMVMIIGISVIAIGLTVKENK